MDRKQTVAALVALGVMWGSHSAHAETVNGSVTLLQEVELRSAPSWTAPVTRTLWKDSVWNVVNKQGDWYDTGGGNWLPAGSSYVKFGAPVIPEEPTVPVNGSVTLLQDVNLREDSNWSSPTVRTLWKGSVWNVVNKKGDWYDTGGGNWLPAGSAYVKFGAPVTPEEPTVPVNGSVTLKQEVGLRSAPSWAAPVVRTLWKGSVWNVVNKKGDWYDTGGGNWLPAGSEHLTYGAPVVPEEPSVPVNGSVTLKQEVGLRSAPSWTAPVVRTLWKGSVWNVVNKKGDWYDTGGGNWLPAGSEHLTYGAPVAPEEPTVPVNGSVTLKQEVGLRSAPSWTAPVVRTLWKGSVWNVVNKKGDWYDTGGGNWLPAGSEHLTYGAPVAPEEPTPTTPAVGTIYVNKSVNVRSTPSWSGSVLKVASPGTSFQVHGINGAFYNIGPNQWIPTLTEYVSFSTSTVTYQLVDGTTQTYGDISQVYSAFSQASSQAYITQDGAVIDMKSGFARSNKFTNIYDSNGNSITYVSSNTEMDVTSITNDKVYISMDGISGYVPKANVELIPFSKNATRSYYMRKNNELIHYLYNPTSNTHYGVVIGKSPSFLSEGAPVYSYNINNLLGQVTYPYYTHLSVRTSSSYTGDQLDSYIRSQSPDSPLIGTGKDFVEIGNKYGINPLYLLAHAIHESGWGKSKIAIDKKNLFGIGAVDSDPYRGAYTFSSYRECIEFLAGTFLSGGSYTFTAADGTVKTTTYSPYIYSSGWKYKKGAVLGNKGVGLNVLYASDAYWGEKIAGHMYRADKYLGLQDYGKYRVAKLPQGSKIYAYNPSTQQKTVIETLSSDRYVTLQDSTDYRATDNTFVNKIFGDYNKDAAYRIVYADKNSLQILPTN